MSTLHEGILFAKQLIAENQQTKAPFLDLGNCGITDLNTIPELFELTHLEGLNLGDNYYDGSKRINTKNRRGDNSISSIPAYISKFKMLKKLYLSSNNLNFEAVKTIAENLKQLTQLNLNWNNIGSEGAVVIAEKLKQLTQLDLRDNRIEAAGLNAITENLKLLTQLDLGANEIGDEGAKMIAQNLKQLKRLYLFINDIGEVGVKAIAENLKELTEFDLSMNDIGETEVIIIAKNIIHLKKLDLSWNKIGIVGAKAIAENLKQLTQLKLSHNEIRDEGVKAIAENLSELTLLYLDSNKVGSEGAKAIAENLKDLKELYLDYNRIGEEGAKAIAENLKLLTQLNLTGNKIGEAGAKAIAENLKQLTQLSLRRNKIGEAGAKAIAENLKQLTRLDLSNNILGVASAKAIAENLKLLTRLDLRDNKIYDEGTIAIAENLKDLKELYIENNRIGEAGAKAIAENLKHLTKIGLGHNEIGDEGAKAISENLTQLSIFILDNIGMRNSRILSKLNSLRYLSIHFNPLKDIPESLIGELSDMRVWWQETEKNTEPNTIVKLMVNGNGNAGKSTLIHALKQGKCEEDKDSTHGIIIDEWQYEEVNKPVHFHIWDFGGQEIFHGTHRLFMQSQALWLHVFDSETEQLAIENLLVSDRTVQHETTRNHIINFWIDEAGDDNPKVVVQTKKSKPQCSVRNKEIAALAATKNMGFDFVDSKVGEGINRLRSLIHEKAIEVNEYGMPMPQKWIKARQHFLNNLQKGDDAQKTISKNEYYKLCKNEFGIEENIANTLLIFLHNSGVLYYNERFLNNVIITDQRWALNAIYKPLERGSDFYNNMRKFYLGRVKASVIYEAFGNEYTKPQKQLFISLMQSCGLCYNLNEHNAHNEKVQEQEQWYVFPEFLPQEITKAAKDLWEVSNAEYSIYRLKMPYFNYYRIQNFIVSVGQNTLSEYVWRNGILVKTAEGIFLVEADYNNPGIVVKIHNSAINKWLHEILSIFQLRERDKNTFWVKLDAEGNEEEVNVESLHSGKQHNTDEFHGQENTQTLAEKLPHVKQIPPKRLVVSYASEDIQALYDLEECMEDLIHNGKVQLLYDKRAVDGTSEFSPAIQNMFQSADGYLILASMKYQNRSVKEYIWKNEFPIIHSRLKTDSIFTFVLAVAPVKLNSDLSPLPSYTNAKTYLPEKQSNDRTKYLLDFIEEVIDGKFLK